MGATEKKLEEYFKPSQKFFAKKSTAIKLPVEPLLSNERAWIKLRGLLHLRWEGVERHSDRERSL